jgi:integrase
MAGSIRLVAKPNTWELRAYAGRDAKGRVQHVHRRFQGTKRAAEKELALLLTEVARSPKAVVDEPTRWDPKTTINDAIEAWRLNGWEDLSPTTVRRYDSLWKLHIEDTIGRRAIATLSPYDVERYFRSLKSQGLAEGSVRYVRAVLNRACKLAKKWSGGSLPNPIADTELPQWKLSEKADPVRSPEVDEVRAVLIAASEHEDPRIAAFIRLVAATGMRRGEACALRWRDIDAKSRVLVVNESVVGASGGASVKQPKTRASIRTLVVDEDTLAEIENLWKLQLDLAESCEVEVEHDAFVFSFEPGGQSPPHPDAMSHGFARARRRACVSPDLHLHSLRHFQATVIDNVVSERQKQARLGWSTTQMARHYTDPVREEDVRAAEHVRRVLAAEGTPHNGQGD